MNLKADVELRSVRQLREFRTGQMAQNGPAGPLEGHSTQSRPNQGEGCTKVFVGSNLRVEFDFATHFAAARAEKCVLIQFILRSPEWHGAVGARFPRPTCISTYSDLLVLWGRQIHCASEDFVYFCFCFSKDPQLPKVHPRCT